MSGFEVVGVVLGVITLLISALEHYERGISTVQRMRHRAKVMHSLAQDLSTEQTILRNTCETLLGGDGGVRSDDLKPLLAEPFGSLWQNPDIRVLVERRLDHTQDTFEALVSSMKETLEELMFKLDLGPNCEIKVGDGMLGKRDMIKIAMQFTTHEDSLKRLSEMNQKLHMLMDGNVRNASHRSAPSQVALFNVLQKVSRSIYNALRSSLPGTCAQSHGVCFRPPTQMIACRGLDEESIARRLNFHVVFANNILNGRSKAHSTWVWDELILRLYGVTPKESTAAVISAGNNTHVAKKSRFNRVRFLNTDMPILRSRSTSPTSAGESSTTKQPAASQVGSSTSSLPPPRETGQLLQVKNICRILDGKAVNISCQDPYGYLIDDTTQQQRRFEMLPFRTSRNDSDYVMVHLNDVFSQRARPPLARKYHIASTAASVILFLHNTRWVTERITTEDVFLVARHGNIEFEEIYLANKSLHDLENPTNVSDSYPSTKESGESALYYLGVFLVEVMFWKPIYKFWDGEEDEVCNLPFEDILDFTTDKGFARIDAVLRKIAWSSPDFAQVVEHCIKCDLRAATFSLEDETFRQEVYRNIVRPLQDMDSLVGQKMIVGIAGKRL
ncbi:hypothetical protein F5Y16DRAFT_405201 [Xylariaceae sp. FL0255]|nr:hypothetical protein F5Y16DRAFT_405201 [Xylariaceae sp. FL0255]